MLILESYNEFQIYEERNGTFLAIDEVSKTKYSGFKSIESLKDFLDNSPSCNSCGILTDNLSDADYCELCD